MRASIQDRLKQIEQQLQPAVRTESTSLSAALAAVVREMHAKLTRAAAESGGEADDSLVRDRLVEAEEAADSAKAAAQAELSADPEVRTAVIEAHNALAELKKAFLRTANLSAAGRSPAQEQL